jgi:hypothetical protein
MEPHSSAALPPYLQVDHLGDVAICLGLSVLRACTACQLFRPRAPKKCQKRLRPRTAERTGASANREQRGVVVVDVGQVVLGVVDLHDLPANTER